MDLTQIALLFAVVEAAVQSIDLYRQPKAVAAGILGAAVLFASDFNILVSFGVAEDGQVLQIVGLIVGGLLAMRGAGVLNSLYKQVGA